MELNFLKDIKITLNKAGIEESKNNLESDWKDTKLKILKKDRIPYNLNQNDLNHQFDE